MSQIYAIDFDGTLCSNIYPNIGFPKEKTIEYMKARQQEGNKIILWTCRKGDLLDQAIDWCSEKGLEFDAVNENLEEVIERFKGDTRKIYADFYIDDRNLDINITDERSFTMITKDRIYRSFEVMAGEKTYIVEGYAVVFDTVETMFECDGIKYKEEIRSGAFDNTDMKDVVLNFNHGGKPVARTKNNTLELSIDQRGLFVRADLSGTEEGRRLYDEVKGGYLDKMSFSFTINSEEYNQKTRIRSITEVKRLFDVAIVDIPAYESTSVMARNFFQAEAERELAEVRKAEHKKQLLRIKLNLLEAE